MVEIRFHPEAQEDDQTALDWYHERSPGVAEGFETETDRILASVKANPELFPRSDDHHRFAMFRRFPFGVVHQIEPDAIMVVAVAHSRRAPGYWRGRA